MRPRAGGQTVRDKRERVQHDRHVRCFVACMMRAVICGAGVTGLVLATQLGRAGWEVVLVAPTPLPCGGGFLVKLCDEGLDAAKQLGLLPCLTDLQEPIAGVHWI